MGMDRISSRNIQRTSEGYTTLGRLLEKHVLLAGTQLLGSVSGCVAELNWTVTVWLVILFSYFTILYHSAK
jgi:hypothetical protein